MRTIHVIAHPEATHHIEKVVGGWHDSDLTPAGRGAADAIARALRADIPEGTDVEVISSDLRRAAHTADAVGELFGVKPLLDRRLREKSYGEAEGGPQEWLDRRFVPPPAEGDRMGHHEGLPGADWVRLKPAMAGVCGTDIALLTGRTSAVLSPFASFPAVLGHEVVGEVEEVGDAVEDRGPVLYRSIRPGIGGEPFACFKFRTMR